MATSKKREEFNLDEALSAAESGDAGQMLKGAAEQIEPRVEFTRHLEARLQDGTPAYSESTPHNRPVQEATIGSEPLAVKWLRRFERTFIHQARGTSIRAARVAFGLVGLVGIVAILVGMALMLRMRQEVSQNNGTPTVFAGGAADSQALADAFELLHIIKPEQMDFWGQPLLMRWSPDGQTLATGAGTHLQLWSRETGQLRARIDTPIIHSMDWSSGGVLLAVGTEENKVLLVDTETGVLLHTFAGPFAAPAYRSEGWSAWYSEVTGLAFSPDGSMLVAFVADVASTIPATQPIKAPNSGEIRDEPDKLIQIMRIWDVRTGEQLRSIAAPDGPQYNTRLSWSPDGRSLASLAPGGPVRLWDPETGEQLHQLDIGNDISVQSIQWSPDGQVLAVITGRTVRLWDVASGRVRYTLPASLPAMPSPWPQDLPTPPPAPAAEPTYTYVLPTPAPDTYYYVSSVLWSADGKTLFVCDFHHIRRWDVVTGRLIETNLTNTDWHMWSHNGRMLASRDGAVKLGDPFTGRLLRTLIPYAAGILQWSHDGYTLAIGKLDTGPGTKITSVEIEMWGIRSLATAEPEPTSTPDVRTSLPVATIPAMETSVTTPTAREVTTEVEPTPSMADTPIGTSTTLPSPTASPDPRRVCSGWSVVGSPSVDTVNELQAVTAVSSNDVWAVGYSSTDDVGFRDGTPVPVVERTLIMHWDGTTWSTVPSPSLGKTTNRLESINAVSEDDVWAVGYYSDGPEPNQPLTTSQTMVLHWDGQRWKDVYSPDGDGATLSSLAGVVALSSDNIWAVGTYGSYRENVDRSKAPIESSRTLIIHWDGKRWSQVDSPNPGVTSNGLSAIAAVSSDDIWAVGTYVESVSEGNYVTRRLLFLLWNGKTWDRVAEPDIQGYFLSLSSLAAIKADDVWAVGTVGSGDPEVAGIIVHWDGQNWTETPDSKKEYGSTAGFASAAASGSDDIWTVSGFGFPTLHHWDGRMWNISYPNGLPQSLSPTIRDLAATSSNDVWAVGTTNYHGQPRSTLVVRYSGPGCITPVP